MRSQLEVGAGTLCKRVHQINNCKQSISAPVGCTTKRKKAQLAGFGYPNVVISCWNPTSRIPRGRYDQNLKFPFLMDGVAHTMLLDANSSSLDRTLCPHFLPSVTSTNSSPYSLISDTTSNNSKSHGMAKEQALLLGSKAPVPKILEPAEAGQIHFIDNVDRVREHNSSFF